MANILSVLGVIALLVLLALSSIWVFPLVAFIWHFIEYKDVI